MHRLHKSEQRDQDRHLSYPKNGRLYQPSWKSQVCNEIRPYKRILASSVGRTRRRDFNLCANKMKNSLAIFQRLIVKVIAVVGFIKFINDTYCSAFKSHSLLRLLLVVQ